MSSGNRPLLKNAAAATGGKRAAQVIVVSSVMFTFISYWRTAAVVLCDMSSTVFYIGAIVESAIGKAAPWFILAVLLFSYAMRTVYIESSVLFVRGGVYRVVKEALGGVLAKLSVSALLFDYILTGPISGVSAGQYIMALLIEALAHFTPWEFDDALRQALKAWGSVLIASAIVLYFLRQNLIGIRESSDKALKIMIATTVMGAILITWSLATLGVNGAVNGLPTWKPDLSPKVEMSSTGEVLPKISPLTGEQEDPLGVLPRIAPALAEELRSSTNWLSVIGFIGIAIAFGHSILAMSGEETLAQVYREVESPKLPNFKKAALVVFMYSFILTGSLNLLALVLIPDDLRMGAYYDNWMGGLAMQLIGPVWVRLALNALVVVVGFLILAGAVNTSIIGSNGVLSRVAEDGVLPDWFLKPHRQFGTTSRLLWLITGLQLFTIVVSRGNVILLGEAYAFGVVWSFVFKCLSMVVLRFKDRSPREYIVPLNLRWRGRVVPLGLMAIFAVVLCSALANLVTKPVATASGLLFSAAFFVVFITTEQVNERRRRGARHVHLEQFNHQTTAQITPASLGLVKPFCKLIAIRSPQNLSMLEKSLEESDPEITDVVVMTAKVSPPGAEASPPLFDQQDQELMTAVVERAERAGKHVRPLIVATNSPLEAVLKTAQALGAQEIVLGASNKYSAEEQLDQLQLYWIHLHQGQPRGLTVKIRSRTRDLTFDVAGGSRIPRLGELRARTAAELRALGIGVDRVLLVHGGSTASSDAYHSLLTMLDPDVALDLAAVVATDRGSGRETVEDECRMADRLGRKARIYWLTPDGAGAIVRLAQEEGYDLIVIPAAIAEEAERFGKEGIAYVSKHAHCPVSVISSPAVPREVERV